MANWHFWAGLINVMVGGWMFAILGFTDERNAVALWIVGFLNLTTALLNFSIARAQQGRAHRA